MDPLSTVYFMIFLPIAVIYAGYVIVRFRRNHTKQQRNFKAEEIASANDLDIINPADKRDNTVEGK